MTLQEELEAEAKNILLLPHSWFRLYVVAVLVTLKPDSTLNIEI